MVGTLPVLALGWNVACLAASQAPRRLDPAAWGGDHVGKPLPELVSGDECLFCHRSVGSSWADNRHNRTVRAADEDSPALAALKQSPAKALAGEVRFVMGDRQRQRFLKPAKEYGRVELLSVQWIPPRGGKPGRLLAEGNPHWNGAQFGSGCAGCHATAVDPKEQAFASLSIDCSACHGSVPAEHTRMPERALLSPKARDPARVVTSICAQCHVRTGKSKSTGRPYPSSFVAGDNLFRDFQVDLSDQALKQCSGADRHVLANVRDVVVFGKESVTCLTCHDIHGRSSKKHSAAPRTAYCASCHQGGSWRNPKPLPDHSRTCEY